MQTIRRFRIVAIAEGISYLAIFFVSMPLKYIWHIGWPNKVIGLAHGVLFVLYLFYALQLFTKLDWPKKRIIPVGLASIIPFGTFWLERKYLRD